MSNISQVEADAILRQNEEMQRKISDLEAAREAEKARYESTVQAVKATAHEQRRASMLSASAVEKNAKITSKSIQMHAKSIQNWNIGCF